MCWRRRGPAPGHGGALLGAGSFPVVVGSPERTDVRCRSVEEMKLVNLLAVRGEAAHRRSRLPSAQPLSIPGLLGLLILITLALKCALVL
jgi:hypothetical protein